MKYDIAIIGGGPAGLMSAGRAGELGAKVILLEKNASLGIKLLATGGGRANISNNSDASTLAKSFGPSGKWLLSALSRFDSFDLISFFENLGLKIKVEKDNKIFPVSNSARDVLDKLTEYLKSSQVKIKYQSEVKKVITNKNKIEKIILSNGEEIIASNYIICTGGKSYPLTGSTGEAYAWLKKMGHTITKLRPALVPIILKEKFIKNIEGASLKAVNISCYQKNKKVFSIIGDAIFTADGISGPAIFTLTSRVDLSDADNSKIKIDFFPDISWPDLDKKIQIKFNASNRAIKNVLEEIISPKLAGAFLFLSKIEGDKRANSLTKEERKKIILLLKELELNISALAGYDKAMITAGGVDLKEVDPKTMKSKIIDNLYLAGEILDLHGPTGGYNLQLCWTTGHLAGESAFFKEK